TDASMGVIAVGIARLATPLRFFTADTADGTEKALVPLVATTFWAASGVFFLAAAFVFGFLAATAEALFFLSTRARVSANHAAFALPPRNAFLLLCHSGEPSSPPICGMVLPLRIDVSYESMSNGSTTSSSCFLISSH